MKKETIHHEVIDIENLKIEGRADGYEDAEWDEHDNLPFPADPSKVEERAEERADDGITEGWLPGEHRQLYVRAFEEGYLQYVDEYRK